LLDEGHQAAVIIENKIGSGEHDDQLQRYWQVVRQHRPGYKIIGLFLTPEGQPPSDDRYIAISYQLICQIVEELMVSRSSTLGQEVLTLMSHYAAMLRRYIVGESEIEQLCQQIYRKHKQALDLIYEYRVDQQAEIKDILVELITQNPLFELDHSSKSYINFIPKKWDVERLREGKGWTRSGRILLFQFANTVDSLKLSLSIGPGPAETRQKLFDMAGQYEPPFKRSFKTPGRLWSTIYNRNLLTRSSYQDKGIEEISEEIHRRWKEFLEHEFPKLDAIVASQDWL